MGRKFFSRIHCQIKALHGHFPLLFLVVSFTGSQVDAVTDFTHSLTSPNGQITLELSLEEGQFFYQMKQGSTSMVEKSLLGFVTADGMDFSKDLAVTGHPHSYEGDSEWKPVVGLDAVVKDCHKGVQVELLQTKDQKKITLDFRLFNEGMGFRYLFGEGDKYEVKQECTQIRIPQGTKALAHFGGNQCHPQYSPVERLSQSSKMEAPLTLLYENGMALCIVEADVENYCRFKLKHQGNGLLKVLMDDGVCKIGAQRVLSETITSKQEYVVHPQGSLVAVPDETNANKIKEYNAYQDGDKGLRVEALPITSLDLSFTRDVPETPWRVLMVGENLSDLLASYTLVENLSDPADEEQYHFSQWLEAGSYLRGMVPITMENLRERVDEAEREGIRYVAVTCHYGPEFIDATDIRLNPAALINPQTGEPWNLADKYMLENYFAQKNEAGEYTNGYKDPATGQYTGEGVFINKKGYARNSHAALGTPGDTFIEVDVPAICDYAESKGIKTSVYVSGHCYPDSRGRYTDEELFQLFAKWGVDALKPGFVRHGSQFAECYMENIIRLAAQYKMALTIHDEYLSTGLNRTYPNLLETEGILGDEGTNSSEILPIVRTVFTRPLQGPVDNTFIYPSETGHVTKASKAFQLAHSLILRAGMPVLYWYTNPNQIDKDDVGRLGFWKDFPGTWDETLYLEANAEQGHVTLAKRSGDKWYLGSMSAHERVAVPTPLSFLQEGVTYVASFYTDDASTVVMADKTRRIGTDTILHVDRYLVNSQDVYKAHYRYGTGMAATFTPAGQEELALYPVYSEKK